jgi:peptide-methionine (S)-S-oxide reductase
MRISVLVIFAALAAACPSARAADAVVPTGYASAVFAGGCFWCIEKDFEKLEKDGVLTVTSGYAGGPEKNPTYDAVSSHKTGHAEVVKVVYDPKKISYEKLVAYFFRHVDVTQADGQFCDIGKQYRAAVFVANDAERKIADAERARAQGELDRRHGVGKLKIVTEIVAAAEFWPAENYHQDFYKKQPDHYARYRKGCGRDARVEVLWGGTSGH